MNLLGSEHICIGFGSHFDEFLIVSLHLGHVLIGELLRIGRPCRADAHLCATIIVARGVRLVATDVGARSVAW